MGTIDTAAIKAANPLWTTVERLTNQQVTQHKIMCPFHEDSTPSLHIYDDESWHCFGCGAHGGDVIDFVGWFYFGQQYDPASHFTDVVDRLGALEIAPLPAHTTKPKPKLRPSKRTLQLDLDTIMAWHEAMPQARRDYWYTRGLTDPIIDNFMLGWDGKRYTIPHVYRLVPFGCKRRRSDIDDGIEAKYTSVTGGRAGLFNADVLWSTDRIVICEGEVDCMLLNQYGFPAICGTAGASSWKPKWTELLSHIRDVRILYDNDAAGREGAAKVRATMRRARIVTLPEGIGDVGELLERHDWPVTWLDGALGE